MKTLFLKSLIQISDCSISLFIFSLFQKYLEILKFLYSFGLKIPSILLYCVLSDVLKKSNTEMELTFLQKQKQLKQEQDYSLQIRSIKGYR